MTAFCSLPQIRSIAAAIAAIGIATLAAGCAGSSTQEKRAVVIVSGGGATSPFTTPTAACKTGYPAGSTDTYLREGLLKAGYAVYTSPAQVGPEAISGDSSDWGFGDCPAPLPASMTVNSVGPIDDAGARLAAFLDHLNKTQGITTFDVVGHSMGGLFSRSAFKNLQAAGSPIRIRSLTTIGTPWEGAFPADYATGGAVTLDHCMGDAVCEASLKEFKEFWLPNSTGAGQQVTRAYLTGAGGWNERQGNVLQGIPVMLIGGDYLRTTAVGTRSEVWPNDVLVSLRSALATGVSDTVLPHRQCATVNDVHSIYFASKLGIARDLGITYDPRVLALVKGSIENAPNALAQPNRAGCPQPA